MSVVTYEGVVKDGRVQLPAGVILPERARVYVVVPAPETPRVVRIASPRLAHREQAADFIKDVIPESPDAGI
jgi:hypothetical protein